MYYEEMETNVGFNSDGTFSVPDTVQQKTALWDSPGGVPGDYSGVIDILKTGIGAWSQYQRGKQMTDYQRWEATQGGLYPTGYPAGMQTAQGRVQIAGNNNMMLILLVVGAFLILRK